MSWGSAALFAGVVIGVGSFIAGCVNMDFQSGPKKGRFVTRKGSTFMQNSGADLRARFPWYTNWGCGIGSLLILSAFFLDR